MGRSRLTNRAFPPRMRLRHGAFYYVDSRGGAKPWVHIGKTYA